MNRVPAKQIYLLSVIIVGIIALSVYSTYALFTFESETTDIVSIHTPKSLTISENVYEYQQIKIEPNTVATTDVDISNSYDYDVCYSIWYKVVGDIDTQNKVQIFQKTEDNISTSGVLSPNKHIKITLAIINDNDTEVKVNLGTIGASKNVDSCSLNISEDKHVITSSYKNIDILTTKLLEEKDKIQELDEGYITYKNETEIFTFNDKNKINVSKEFTYTNEMFTLKEPEELTIKEILEKYNLENDNLYFCLNNSECQMLYKINNIETEIIEAEKPEDVVVNYKITKYDKLIGYSKGNNGLRLINEKDYIFYGDNPNNFIYYNCENNDNLNSCELWRIVGFFYNEETKKYNTKIVRNESIGKYQFDNKIINDINESTNNWNESTLNKYLNEEYELINKYDIYLDEYKQSVERILDLETDVKNIKIKEENINSKISILSLSDYLYASSCQKTKINQYTEECLINNWLNNIEIKKEWTMTSKEVIENILPEENEEQEPEEIIEEENNQNDETILEETTEELTETENNNYVINYVYGIGENITENDVNESLDLRPVLFLKSRIILLDGDGSLQNPYIVK